MAHVGHSACHSGTKMVVFGGYGHRQYWNELVLLDTGIMTWMRPHTSGAAPHPCVLHTATIVHELMIVFGGALDERPLDQLAAIDLVEMRWSRLGYNWGGLRPVPRFGHAAAAIGSRIFVFGGTSGDKDVPWWHFFPSLFKGRELVHGYSAQANNELLLIDLEARHFSQPTYAGELPLAVYRHTLTQSRGKLFVFGGVGSSASPTMKMLDTGLNIDAEMQKGAPRREEEAAAAEEEEESGRSKPKEEASKGLDAGAAAAVVALLQEIGLNKYARVFLKQEVDLDSLLQFGDQDLKDIGVVAIGARRKLTAAIHRNKLRKMQSPVDDAYNAHGSGLSEDQKLQMPMFRGRYRLTGRTYLGGSALVKMATDEKTGVEVAIKIHAKTTTFVRELKFLRLLRSEYTVELPLSPRISPYLPLSRSVRWSCDHPLLHRMPLPLILSLALALTLTLTRSSCSITMRTTCPPSS